MVEFKEIYYAVYSFDNSVYAGLAVIATAVVSAGAIFYLGKKYCLKDSEKKEKGNNLEKKIEK
jgi:hypothetical protein